MTPSRALTEPVALKAPQARPPYRDVRIPLAPGAAERFTRGMEDLTDDQRYAVITARDARFDGMFFVCVRSTGIFCRPSCPARTPGRDRVEFVRSAASAVARGFRACKRCGPLDPPAPTGTGPSASLAARALQLISEGALDAGSVWDDEEAVSTSRDDRPASSRGVPGLAARLHVTERTLHRALVAHTGVGALAYARMVRARRAHELLRTTDLPVGEVAVAAGFGSEQQLRDALTRIYDTTPTAIRHAGSGRRSSTSPPARPDGGGPGNADGAALVRAELSVRRPFHGEGLAAWFAHRAIPGVEHVDGTRWTRAVHLHHGPAVLEVDLGAPASLPLTAHLGDLRDYPAAVALVRRMLDLDADPVGIDRHLAAALPALAGPLAQRPGVRIPGTESVHEALLWAVVGQQITTTQARDQIARATDLVGEGLPEPLRTEHVHRLPVRPTEAARTAEQWFRGPGARRRSLITALSATLDPAGPLEELRAGLLAMTGIGPWTADYALLRGARATDSAPARDVAMLAAARDLGIADDDRTLMQALAPASPWRSYAALHLWLHRSTLTAKDTT